ncbi:MAG: hypothetical protein IPJ06_07390 [Saprospiraceae bacterium]|nr:hypothetical protein [Saprospiraceae bacterium]
MEKEGLFLISIHNKVPNMKKLLLLLLLVPAALTIQAQSAKHNCASHSAAATSVSAEVSDEAIAQAASLDESIERRVCETSGKVSYYRKDVCQKSGKVSYEAVSYDAANGQFVNASPSDMNAKDAKSCCASKGASATATSGQDGKAALVRIKENPAAPVRLQKGTSASIAPTAKKVKND